MQYVARPVNALKYTTVESRLFPVRQGESIPLHSHISGSSFQSGDQHQSQIELHIYQQPECQVESVTLSLDVSATLAKAMLRWRVSVVVWIAAWLAVILSLQLEEFARTGELPC